MALIHTVGTVLYILFFGVFVYVFMIADPDKSAFARVIGQDAPLWILENVVGRLCGADAVLRVGRWKEYLFYERNPSLQIVYLLIVLGGQNVCAFYGFPEIYTSQAVADYHVYTSLLSMVAAILTFRWASTADPGRITPRTMAKYDKNYEYDGVLFLPDRVCHTTGMPRLARSKYCRISRRHVPRFDHFCSWINQPVGQENYRAFLTFVATQVAMCAYGAYLTTLLFHEMVVDKDLLNATFYNAATGEMVKATYVVVFHYLFAQHSMLFGAYLLMLVMGLCLHLFLCFHVYLTCRNLTTNEFMKWRAVRKWHKQATKRYQQAVKKGRAGVTQSPSDTDATNTYDKQNNTAATVVAALENKDVSCTGGGGTTSTRTTTAIRDKEHCTDAEERNNDDEIIMDDTIDPGPMPSNMYDLGIVENIKEMLFPRSLRKDALVRWAQVTVEAEKQYQKQHQQQGLATMSEDKQSKKQK